MVSTSGEFSGNGESGVSDAIGNFIHAQTRCVASSVLRKESPVRVNDVGNIQVHCHVDGWRNLLVVPSSASSFYYYLLLIKIIILSTTTKQQQIYEIIIRNIIIIIFR